MLRSHIHRRTSLLSLKFIEKFDTSKNGLRGFYETAGRCQRIFRFFLSQGGFLFLRVAARLSCVVEFISDFYTHSE